MTNSREEVEAARERLRCVALAGEGDYRPQCGRHVAYGTNYCEQHIDAHIEALEAALREVSRAVDAEWVKARLADYDGLAAREDYHEYRTLKAVETAIATARALLSEARDGKGARE